MTKVKALMNTVDTVSATIFWTLIVSIVLSGSAYIYLVNKTVWNAYAKDSAEERVVSLNSKLGDLEFAYMNATESITIEKAHELGYLNVGSDSNVYYATRELYANNVAMK